MSIHHFYNYQLSPDDADCSSFILYDYLGASRKANFRCKTIKDFMYFLLLGRLTENEVLSLLFEAMYYLPRRDILYECNIPYDDYKDLEFGKFICMKRMFLFKLFNALSEEEFVSFARRNAPSRASGDFEPTVFQLLDDVMDKWENIDKMEECLEYLKKFYVISEIPNIIEKYRRCDKGNRMEIKIPNDVELKDIYVTLEKGDQSCDPKFLVNSADGPKTINYDKKNKYPYPEDGDFKSACLIFNIWNYKSRERRGAAIDVDLIRKTFTDLHFTVQVQENLPKKEIFKVVELYSQLELEKAGTMFVCFILAHGEKDHIFDINEELVSFRELSMKFSAKNCEAYRGKPKVFFVQACQGEKFQEGIPVTKTETQEFTVPEVEQDGGSKPKIKEYKQHSYTPEEADFIVGMSTVADCVSFRDVKKGSWYVTALCKRIKEKATRCHLVDILTDVTGEVSLKPYRERYCQLPIFCSTATKRCFLTIPEL